MLERNPFGMAVTHSPKEPLSCLGVSEKSQNGSILLPNFTNQGILKDLIEHGICRRLIDILANKGEWLISELIDEILKIVILLLAVDLRV